MKPVIELNEDIIIFLTWGVLRKTTMNNHSGPLSPVVVFFDHGHPRFWNFYSSIPVDVVRVKSYVNCLFDPTCVVTRVTINKLS